MSFYSDSRYLVNGHLASVHAKQIQQLAEPGSWGTGAQRLAIAQETLQSCYKAGLSEKPDQDGPAQYTKL